MTAKVRRVDFSPDEWLTGTRELTLEERGAYWDVCALIYSRGGPIPDDRKMLMAALGVDRMRIVHRLIDGLLARGKLELMAPDAGSKIGRLMNGRAAVEIERSRQRIGGLRHQPKATTEPRPSHDRATTEPQVSHDRATSEPRVSHGEDRVSSKFNGLYASCEPVTRARALNLPTINHQPEEKITPAKPIERGALAKGARRAKREVTGTRLPAEWRPEDVLRQWTIDSIRDASSGVSAGHELERFRDHWRAQPGSKGTKADWSATWRNWIRRAIDMEGSNGRTQRGKASGHANGSAPTVADGIAAAYARRSVPPRG